jgi:hypothetical protein
MVLLTRLLHAARIIVRTFTPLHDLRNTRHQETWTKKSATAACTLGVMGPRHPPLPAWAKAARIIFALSPNSAACERVFSLLKHFLGDQQMSALADGIAAGLMLAYNKRAFG